MASAKVWLASFVQPYVLGTNAVGVNRCLAVVHMQHSRHRVTPEICYVAVCRSVECIIWDSAFQLESSPLPR
jgi:hypothetical protein